MSHKKVGDKLVRGSGNVFRDFDLPAAGVQQTKAILAAKIIGILDDDGLSTRKAQEKTGIDHADFARIRNARLGRFTIDRLMTIVERLGRQIEVQIRVRPLPPDGQTLPPENRAPLPLN